jgi:hypothetical protein
MSQNTYAVAIIIAEEYEIAIEEQADKARTTKSSKSKEWTGKRDAKARESRKERQQVLAQEVL